MIPNLELSHYMFLALLRPSNIVFHETVADVHTALTLYAPFACVSTAVAASPGAVLEIARVLMLARG